jgi:hypothetical protein
MDLFILIGVFTFLPRTLMQIEGEHLQFSRLPYTKLPMPLLTKRHCMLQVTETVTKQFLPRCSHTWELASAFGA